MTALEETLRPRFTDDAAPGAVGPATADRLLAAGAELNPHPILVFSGDAEITFANAAAHALATALGLDHPRDLLPERTAAVVQMCLRSGQRRPSFETSIHQRTLLWDFFPLPGHQAVQCYLTDATERHRLEDQCRHAQKLESVGRLAAGVAHDFNNILTVIQGHTSLLRTSPGMTPEARESLQAITRAAERAIKLTSQLLLFSRKSALQPRRLNLNEVLTSMSLLLQRTLGEDIEFQFQYEPALPDIQADVGLIEQVVMSLAVNARDAMAKGGSLLVRTAVASLDDAEAQRHADASPGQFVCLTLTDTGCGMDRVTLGRLFEPFFTTKEFGKGTGLGLATVYGIVRQHQGWIEVQSQLGQGTTFSIFLPPAEPSAEPVGQPASKPATRGGNETVLVVEDEPPVRWTVRNILERYGYRVLEAGAGVEALAVWHQHHADIRLLLTDVVMPAGLTGQELAETFRHQKPDLKVIYTSGYSLEAAGKGLELVSGLSFLQKPFEASDLALAVRRCLDEEP